MLYDSTINSSDVETSPLPPPQRLATAGQKSTDEIISHAMQDRLASKEEVKALTLTLGRLERRRSVMMWSMILKLLYPLLGVYLSIDTDV